MPPSFSQFEWGRLLEQPFLEHFCLDQFSVIQGKFYMQYSRRPRLVEHFWVPILGASCSNKLFVGTVRPSHVVSKSRLAASSPHPLLVTEKNVPPILVPPIHLKLRTPRPATEPRIGPSRNFHEKYRKNTPRPEILDSRIYPKNTPKIPKKYRKNTKIRIFSVFFRYFRGIFLGFQNFGPGGIFLVFFVEIPARAISGLCSRSGRS